MQADRRFDLDWVRVIAIGLLLLYHVAIGFQSWGIMIGFITTPNTWDALWIPMTMLNVWRIPLLFFVSGMGVYFSLQNRTWYQLMGERARRILVPFLFGIVVLVPIHVYLWQKYNQFARSYSPGPAHLWFLGNIFVYIILLLPLFYFLKKNESSHASIVVKRLMSNPLSLLVIVASFVTEAVVVNPVPFELYAMTWHGFFLGLLAFLFGFCFVWCGDPFWHMLLSWRWLWVVVAVALYAYRLFQGPMQVLAYHLAIESCFWIFSIFGFGYRYLNHGGKALRYLSQAAYPVYLSHMIFLYLGSYLIFPLNIPNYIQFALVLMFTLGGCLLFYEFVIRRLNLVRVLFGLKRE